MAKNKTATLTPDEMNEITTDVLLDRPSKINTPEAKAFRVRAEEFSREVEEKGGEVRIPHEFAD